MKKTRIIYLIGLLCLALPIMIHAKDNIAFQITGISGEVLQNVQSRVEITQQAAMDKNDFCAEAPEDIQKALQPFGYFKAHINSQCAGPIVKFQITLGPVIKISRMDIQILGPGKNNPELKKFLQHLPLQIGQPLLTSNYEKTKDNLFEIANEQGYLKAFLEKKSIEINLKNNTAKITLHLNTESLYYFGHVFFGPNPYAATFLERFIPFQENEIFSSEKLQTFQQDLRNSHYFQEAEVTPDFDQATHQSVPVKVNIIPTRSQRYDFGIGYGTYTGARLTLGTELRRVTSTGQHLSAQLKLSSVLSSLTAKYFIPGKNPLTDQYVLGANVQYFSPKNGLSFSQTLSASYDKKLSNWQRNISLNYLNERFRIQNETTHQSQILYPSLNFSFVKADNLIFPRFGNMISFTAQTASQDLFSRTSFFQTELKAKTIFSPTDASRVILRGDVGYTVVENLNQLPLSLRYFAGGLNSVRGYPYNSIGPGKYLEVFSGEIQHRIIGNWSAALFYDIGNASNVFNGQFNRGEGVGMVYQSFLGPMQLYVGRAMSKPGKPFTVEFNIGPDF